MAGAEGRHDGVPEAERGSGDISLLQRMQFSLICSLKESQWIITLLSAWHCCREGSAASLGEEGNKAARVIVRLVPGSL